MKGEILFDKTHDGGLNNTLLGLHGSLFTTGCTGATGTVSRGMLKNWF